MAVPTITIGTPSRTKISSISGYDQATVTFQSDTELHEWEARATLPEITPEHGVGILVESGGSLEANTDAIVIVDDEELTQGDLEYTITVHGHGTDGYWSDGSFEGINILDITDTNIVNYFAYSSYSNGQVIFDTGTQNTDQSETAIKVQELMEDWSYYKQLLFSQSTGIKTVNITKTSLFDTIRISLNGNVKDAAILIDADTLLNDGETYTLTFNVLQISMNYLAISDISLVKAVV